MSARTSTIEDAKSRAIRWIDRNAPAILQTNDCLFSFGEPSMEEYESAAFLVALLKNAGFQVETGISGFPTAFVATWNHNGGPVIALHAEYDGTPDGLIRIAFGSADPNKWVNVTLASGKEAAAPEDVAVADVNGATIRAFYNQDTYLLERVEARLGTTAIDVTYAEHGDWNGDDYLSDVQFPKRITHKRGDATVLDLTVTKTNTYNPYVVMPVPAGMR